MRHTPDADNRTRTAPDTNDPDSQPSGGRLRTVANRIAGRWAYDYLHAPLTVKHKHPIPWLVRLMVWPAFGAIGISLIVGWMLGNPTHELANLIVGGLMGVFVGSAALHVVFWLIGRVAVRVAEGGGYR